MEGPSVSSPNGTVNLIRPIVKDFVGYKLRNENIFLVGYETNDCPSPTCLEVRRVADELIAENTQLFVTMCDQLHITQTTAYPTFIGIADEIFQSGKNWGRIVAFLAFGATLAVHCARREELLGFVDSVVAWVTRYLEQNLSEWINANNGWDGFVIFFQKHEDPKNGQSGNSSWGIAAVAGLGIGALLMLACK